MKILIAEDDFTSRKALRSFLSKYGECDITVDGKEAVQAFRMGLEDEAPYDLICLDIMMPEMDGYLALKEIRKIEEEFSVSSENRVKVIMTTALSEGRNVRKAFELGCEAYAGKPIDQEKLVNVMVKLGLISCSEG